jgi:hypothetical protein
MIIVHFRKNTLKCVVIYFSEKKEESGHTGKKYPVIGLIKKTRPLCIDFSRVTYTVYRY